MTDPPEAPGARPEESAPDRSAPGEARRMPIGVAVAWSSGTILFFWFLAGIVAAIQPDLIALFACEALVLLGAAGLIWLLHGRARAPSIPPEARDPAEAPRPPPERALDFFAVRAAHPGFFPIAALLGIAIHLPVEPLFRFIEQRWPGPSQDLARSFLDAGPAKKVVIGLILVVLGPLIEEIFFRGALYRPLRKTTSAPVTIAVTSIMFAISHFAPQTYVPIAVVGVALGIARHASGSLLPPFLLHAAFNGLSLLGMATASPDEAPDPSAPPLWVTLAGTAVTVALCAALWGLGRRARAGEPDPDRQ